MLISKPIHFIVYGGRHLISMQEIQISMQEGSEQAANQNASSNETASERLSNSGQPIKTTMTS